MSLEHLLFLRKYRFKRLFINFMRFIICVIFLILWEVLSDRGIINSFIYSSPHKVILTLFSLIRDGSLFHHIWVTFYEVMVSFIIGSILGLLISSLFWRFRVIYLIFDPFLTVLNSLPKVSLGPIIIIIFGSGTRSIIVMALLISLIITILNVYSAFVGVDKEKILLMRSFGASRFQIYRYLIIPSNYHNIIDIFKVNISLTFIGVIMGEFLVSKAGIGYLILYGSQVFNLDLVISGVFVLGVLSFILYLFMCKLDKICY